MTGKSAYGSWRDLMPLGTVIAMGILLAVSTFIVTRAYYASLERQQFRRSATYYETKFKPYGLPLDSRKTYTKLDWQIWTATLSDSKEQFERFTAPLGKWLDESTSRVPLTDFYDTVSGKQEAFQARSVVGGIYIKALSDAALAKKWKARTE